MTDQFNSLNVLIEYVTLHEVGHALGLRHPWEANNADPLGFNSDQTVMAYGHNATLTSATLTSNDILALTTLHGNESGERYDTDDFSLPKYELELQTLKRKVRMARHH